METVKFSIKKLANATGLHPGGVKLILDIPVKATCKAKTFDRALRAYTKAREDSDAQLAAYRKLIQFFPEKLLKITTAQAAEKMWDDVEEYDLVDLCLPTLKHWLGLTKTLGQTTKVLLTGLTDSEFAKSVFSKMTTQVKTTSRAATLKALSLMKGEGMMQLGYMMAPNEAKAFLTAIAGLYATREVAEKVD